MQDIGNKNYTPDDLFGQNDAAAYATAKAFTEIYPNVKVNIFAKPDDPNSGGMSWLQHRENFTVEYGLRPDIYAATDVPGDIMRGFISDLTIYRDDPVYKTFNPSVMKMMEYEGRQFGLPQYLIPWGVYINKSLAEQKNLDVPPPNWTIEQYVDFVSNSSAEEFYGAMEPPMDFIRTGTKDIAYQMLNRGPNDPYINVNSEAVRSMFTYWPEIARHSVWPNWDLGNISAGFMDSHWWWGYKYFIEGKLLTLDGDPWMMGDAAIPSRDHWGSVRFDDYDIYPRPSTDFVGNHVGVVLDPFVIRNFADVGGTLSEAQRSSLDVAWELLKFWTADTRAWQARADQLFKDMNDDDGTFVYKSCMNDSFPLVTGLEFHKQMEMWYQPETHQRYADKARMPGFAYVLELWEQGAFWDISDKAYPWTYEFEGSTENILHEWFNYWNPDITGASRTDANWLDQIYARLPDWNRMFNERFAGQFDALKEGINRFYGN
jgi:hypothetical protein